MCLRKNTLTFPPTIEPNVGFRYDPWNVTPRKLQDYCTLKVLTAFISIGHNICRPAEKKYIDNFILFGGESFELGI